MLNSAGVSFGRCVGWAGEGLFSGGLLIGGDEGGRKRPVLLLLVRSEPEEEPVVPFGRRSELIVSNYSSPLSVLSLIIARSQAEG